MGKYSLNDCATLGAGIDANANPLRTDVAVAVNTISDGTAMLGHAPGLGAPDPISAIERYRVAL